MGSLQLHVQGFNGDNTPNPRNPCFDHSPMEEARQPVASGGGGGEIWVGGDQEEDLIDVTDSSIFYDEFPPLPDFPCMSSTSSSSSTPATVKAAASSSSTSSASSSSSAASWAMLKSDGEEDNNYDLQNQNYSQFDDEQHHQQQSSATAAAAGQGAVGLSSTASMELPSGGDGAVGGCMEVMENFGYMDLIDDNDFFDPSSIFNPDDNFLEEFQQELNLQPPEHHPLPPESNMAVDGGGIQLDSPSDDLAMVFLDWLKSNKETVSAEDLRNVKIKKATIECAAKRLGGGKEAMKQLLKLILEWVQTNHLQKRKLRKTNELDPLQNPNPNSHPNPNPNSNSISISVPNDHSTTTTNPPCFTQSPWIPPPYPGPDPSPLMPGFTPMVGYPYGIGAPNMAPNVHNPYPDYHMLEPAQSWTPAQFYPYPDPVPTHTPVFNYGGQYPNPYMQGQTGDSNNLARLGSSATKEARKKRMARQKRFLWHHRNHNSNHHQQNPPQNPATAEGGQNALVQQNPGNWVYWQSGGVVNPNSGSTVSGLPVDVPPVHPGDRPPAMKQNNQPRQAGSDKRQNWKPEKNLRFLLQKVLKQSDVGTLGRIVLPKKEAETHLPELEARDGISIAMEDIGTSRVWNMRYRFWPNNKSRMYLLENTGDFVRTNGLQEGDFIVIYSDVKCGKYLIRGVKVRQGGGGGVGATKAENKKGAKSQKNNHGSSPAGANNSNANQNQNPNQKAK